ncbi:preprotein translocase subunit SecY [Candidatus Woesearchaeota archaeon]|nr:preprotein translocase subunit SecY [Candidatus Woesearchaeota archaeon]
MSFLDTVLNNLPEVMAPTEKRLAFKEKIKWTLITLVLYFILGMVPLFGLGENALQQFEFFEIVLGASFGSIITLGIGPIVTASIVLQLLNGSGLVKFDRTTHEGRARFQGIQKLLSIFFIILEGIIYVSTGGLQPLAGIPSWILIFQLCLGGVMIMMMDEVVSKWGFGSGISLFIAAGVSKTIFVRAFSWLPSPTDPNLYSGKVPSLFQSLATQNLTQAMLDASVLIATVGVFLIVVYTQSMKVEIPLSFGRMRGHGVRWPLNFFYTSNIPVILVAALLANVQLIAQWVPAMSGLAALMSNPNVLQAIIVGSFSWNMFFQSLLYVIIFVIGSLIFGLFWVQTAGLDPASQAKQIMASGLSIPGFRKDQRVLERLLARYIWPLSVIGSIAVGLLASVADLTGALGRGTGILLTVMIIYNLYQTIAQQHVADMNPMMRKFMGGR